MGCTRDFGNEKEKTVSFHLCRTSDLGGTVYSYQKLQAACHFRRDRGYSDRHWREVVIPRGLSAITDTERDAQTRYSRARLPYGSSPVISLVQATGPNSELSVNDRLERVLTSTNDPVTHEPFPAPTDTTKTVFRVYFPLSLADLLWPSYETTDPTRHPCSLCPLDGWGRGDGVGPVLRAE